MKEAERIIQELDALGSVNDYAWGLGITLKENTWRRASKYGPENTTFGYADGSVIWWSPDRQSWLAGV